MKRGRDGIDRCYLLELPLELLAVLMGFMELVDLQQFFNAIQNSKNMIDMIDQYLSNPNTERVDIKKIRDEILEEKLAKIKRWTEGKYGFLSKGEAEYGLEKIKNIVNDKYVHVSIFIGKCLCSRCRVSFICKTLWKGTARPVSLCKNCSTIMDKTMIPSDINIENYADGWAWVSAKQMKKLCCISSSKKATDYANEKNIRNMSSCLTSFQVLILPSLSKRERFFLMDILPLIKK